MQAAGLSLEDYIAEGYVKCANIILSSRIYQPSQQRPPPDRRSGRWFLLEVDELAGLTQRLEPWRRDVFAPLIIEISIQPWHTSTVMPGDLSSSSSTAPTSATGGAPRKSQCSSMLLERWTLCFTPGLSHSSTGSSRVAMDTAAVYKRLILLIRSLHSYVRVLPAFRMFRASKRHGAELFNTTYHLSTTADPSLQPLHPWPTTHQQQPQAAAGTRASTAAGASAGAGRRCQFAFTPVETAGGSFCIHVEYQPATTVHILEQTTIPVSMPRIIANYVDSPYARSVPSTADHISKPAAERGGMNRLSGPDDPLALLRSSQQQQTPLVRHSWSSRDVSGPAVLHKAFSPVNAPSGSMLQQQQQMVSHKRTSSQGSSCINFPASPAPTCQSPTLHGLPSSAGGSSSSWGRPPLPHMASSMHSAALQGTTVQGSTAVHSSSLPSGSNGGLPGASRATAPSGAPQGVARSPLFRSSSLSAAAAIGATGVLPGPSGRGSADEQQQQGAHSSRMEAGVPALLQHRRQHQQHHARPPVQPLSPQSTQQGFYVKPAATHGRTGGQDGSTVSSSAAGCAASEGRGGPLQTDAAAAAGVCADAADPLRAAVTTTMRQHASSECIAEGSAAVPAADAPEPPHAAPGSGQLVQGQSTQHHAPGQPGLEAPPSALPANMPASGAAGAPGHSEVPTDTFLGPPEGPPVTAVSAPVAIPLKSRGLRTKSASDLALLNEGMTAAAAAAAARGQPGLVEGLPAGWQQQQQQVGGEWREGVAAVEPSRTAAPAVSINVPGGVAAELAGLGGGLKGSSSSGMLKNSQLQQQQRQQQEAQLVQAPSSAPAAPRGMLGQLLSAGSGPTSPTFSPRGSTAHRGGSRVVAAAMAAAAAASSNRDSHVVSHLHAATRAVAPQDTQAEGGSSSSSSGTSSAADGIISSTPTPQGAIIIRPNPLLHPALHAANVAATASGTAAAAAATSNSPGGSSSCSSQPNSMGTRSFLRRTVAGQGLFPPGSAAYHAGLGAQPGTPCTVHSYLGSSPQLPFAFTPSALSLGTSLMTIAAEPPRQLLTAPAANAATGSSTAKPLPVASSRSRTQSAAGAAAAAASASPATAAALPSAASTSSGACEHPHAVGHSGASPSSTPALTAGVGIGTPSPPLLYTATATSGGHVSFIRDITGLATIRRPSWSSRSSSFDIAAVGSSISVPHHLSVSPGMADLMDPAIMLGYSSSQGSNAAGAGLVRAAAIGSSAVSASGGSGCGSGTAAAAGSSVPPVTDTLAGQWDISQQQLAPGVSLAAAQHQQQSVVNPISGQQCADVRGDAFVSTQTAGHTHITHVTAAGVSGPVHVAAGTLDQGAATAEPAEGGAHGAADFACEEALRVSTGHDESESDLLPFVLDAEPTALQHHHHAPPSWTSRATGAAALAVAGGVHDAALAGQQQQRAAAQKDVAVGAFLKMVQEAAAAPPSGLDDRRATRGLQQAELGTSRTPEAADDSVPLCVGEAAYKIQELAVHLQQLLFPE